MESWMESWVKEGRIRENVLLKELTSFRIGGPADYVATPGDVQQFRKLWQACRQHGIPSRVIGKGSNLLAADEGYRGMLFIPDGEMAHIRVEDEEILAGAGVSLASLSQRALLHGLTGLEFAGGIPGSLGGAVCMNAGAYGGDMSQVTEEVTVMTPEGECRCLSPEEMDWGYRRSCIQEKELIVLEARIRLQRGDPDLIRSKMKELAAKRKEKQPLEWPSAGSVFKRPEGAFAGQLIEEAGLKGFTVGGACVSEKHAGFIINRGGATAADVKNLIGYIQEAVEQRTGIHLQPEIRFLGPEGLSEMQ